MTRDHRRNLFVIVSVAALGAAAVWYAVQLGRGTLKPYDGPASESQFGNQH